MRRGWQRGWHGVPFIPLLIHRCKLKIISNLMWSTLHPRSLRYNRASFRLPFQEFLAHPLLPIRWTQLLLLFGLFTVQPHHSRSRFFRPFGVQGGWRRTSFWQRSAFWSPRVDISTLMLFQPGTLVMLCFRCVWNSHRGGFASKLVFGNNCFHSRIRKYFQQQLWIFFFSKSNNLTCQLVHLCLCHDAI